MVWDEKKLNIRDNSGVQQSLPINFGSIPWWENKQKKETNESRAVLTSPTFASRMQTPWRLKAEQICMVDAGSHQSQNNQSNRNDGGSWIWSWRLWNCRRSSPSRETRKAVNVGRNITCDNRRRRCCSGARIVRPLPLTSGAGRRWSRMARWAWRTHQELGLLGVVSFSTWRRRTAVRLGGSVGSRTRWRWRRRRAWGATTARGGKPGGADGFFPQSRTTRICLRLAPRRADTTGGLTTCGDAVLVPKFF